MDNCHANENVDLKKIKVLLFISKRCQGLPPLTIQSCHRAPPAGATGIALTVLPRITFCLQENMGNCPQGKQQMVEVIGRKRHDR
jgi:hypothetical protein